MRGEGARTVSVGEGGGGKSASRGGSNGADLFLRRETPRLGAIEALNDEDGEVFEGIEGVGEDCTSERSIPKLIHRREEGGSFIPIAVA